MQGITASVVRCYHPELGIILALRIGDVVHAVFDEFATLSNWLQLTVGRVETALHELRALAGTGVPVYDAALFDNPPTPDAAHWLAPVDEQDIWAAGVTYERSREARQEEAADGGDVYARVYIAERPELFFKAAGRSAVGPLAEVGIRADATWSVPEPELAVVLNPALEVVGFAIGNDMSSRDIEGANPLYLPQAKIYTASCALGPGILLAPANDWPEAQISLVIQRAGQTVFQGDVHTRRIRRAMSDLISYLGRSTSFPNGVVLLTGTGIVPPPDFTLHPGDKVTITIDGIGRLENTVKVV